MTPLRLAIVGHHNLGGSGVMAVEWARLLADRGHDVHLVRAGVGARDRVLDRVAHVEVTPPEHPVLDGPAHEAAIASALIALHRKAPLDVVHIHYALPYALVVPLLATLPDPPTCIVSLHGTDVTGIGADDAYAGALGLGLGAASALTTPSAWLADEAAARFGLARDRLSVLPNFVPLDRFTPLDAGAPRALVAEAFGSDDGTPVVLHVSNFRAVKRVPDVVDIVARLRQRRAVRLVLVGEGPVLDAEAERARTLLREDVHAAGLVADPARWLREADALLLPSESESFGLAALEALASGTPVVASRVGGLPEWIEPLPCAALCPVGDVPAFADALDTLLDDPAGREAVRQRARRAAASVGDPTAAAIALEALYDSLRPR